MHGAALPTCRPFIAPRQYADQQLGFAILNGEHSGEVLRSGPCGCQMNAQTEDILGGNPWIGNQYRGDIGCGGMYPDGIKIVKRITEASLLESRGSETVEEERGGGFLVSVAFDLE